MSDLKLTISEPANELFAALSKAQGEITAASKDANNPFFKSKYADLASVWDACRAPLSKNGICVVQIPSADGQLVTVTTILGHASGQKIVGELSGSAKAADPQSVGSVVTYLRRYSLSAMVSVAPEDDDGNAGTGKPEDHQAARQQQRRQNSADPQADHDRKRQAQSGEHDQTHEPAKKVDQVFIALKKRLHEIGCTDANQASAVVRFLIGQNADGKYEFNTLESVEMTPGAPAKIMMKLAEAEANGMPLNIVYNDALAQAGLNTEGAAP